MSDIKYNQYLKKTSYRLNNQASRLKEHAHFLYMCKHQLDDRIDFIISPSSIKEILAEERDIHEAIQAYYERRNTKGL